MPKTLTNYIINLIIRDDLISKQNYINSYSIPQIEKLVIEHSGSSLETSLLLEHYLSIEIISCQKPLLLKAKHSEAEFKLREGQYIGNKTTVRSPNHIDLLLHLSDTAINRANEDISINYDHIKSDTTISIGISDLTIFPEIEYEYDNIKNRCGFNIHIVSSTTNKLELATIISSIQIPILRKDVTSKSLV